ncbi:MAG: alpha/beta hydrolase [Tagaea sp.]
MSDWRKLSRAELDAAYNNGAAVANSQALLAEWRARSAAFSTAHPGAKLDAAYGSHERQGVDFYPCGKKGAPALLLIHGGYWQIPVHTRATFAALAQGPLAHGIDVGFAGYVLAPQATLAAIVTQIREAIDLFGRILEAHGSDRTRVALAGWSAGGHLAVSTLDHPLASGALAISGIFDLEPLRGSYINDKLGLTEGLARSLSPMRDPGAVRKKVALAVGAKELPELIRQSRDYAAARQAAGAPVTFAELAGRDHFTIVEELAAPDGRLTAMVRELLAV